MKIRDNNGRQAAFYLGKRGHYWHSRRGFIPRGRDEDEKEDRGEEDDGHGQTEEDVDTHTSKGKNLVNNFANIRSKISHQSMLVRDKMRKSKVLGRRTSFLNK